MNDIYAFPNYYIETLDRTTSYNCSWRRATDDATVLIGDTMFDQIVTRVSNNRTLTFSSQRNSGKTIQLTRDNQTIWIRTGKTESQLTIPESAEWLQTPGLLLDQFIRSDLSVKSFVLVGLDRLMVIMLEAKKIKTEDKIIGAKMIRNAQRVELRPAGFLGLFWMATMWFDSESGAFLRYEGPIGGPGSKWFEIEKKF